MCIRGRVGRLNLSDITLYLGFFFVGSFARVSPSVVSDPGHTLWQRDFKGANGLVSIALKNA
jgi:hypothetical protein